MQKKLKLNRVVYVLAVCMLLLAGCKSKKTVQKPVENLSEYTIEQVMQQQPKFTSMNISKMDAVATYGMHQISFHATAKLLTDSLLVLSIQPVAGIEMFRVEFTPTQFVIIDKFNRRYTENSYDFLRYKLGVNLQFSLLQAIVSNHLFLVDKEVEKTDFIVEKVEGEPTRLVHLSTDMIQRFEVADPIAISKAEVLLEQARMTCEYDNHHVQSGIYFPSDFNLQVSAESKNLSLACTVTKVEFNKSIEYTPVSLDRYEKVAFSKIIP